jgi:ATP-dependent helicase/nuclease subunit A
MGSNLRLPFGDEPPPAARRPLRDEAARRAAVDPAHNVVLEASAGTGKTRVLVDRYVNLLRAGVEPLNILAMTFTRKAAAEMRERIVDTLREASSRSPEDAARWRDLRDRLNEIAISTIDAFCLALLREFPLEADLDPGFDVADETAVPRLIDEALDRAMRICRARARDDEDVALLFAQLGERRLRSGLAVLLDRRLVADDALDRALSAGPADLTVASACRQGAVRLAGALSSIPGGLETFLASGPSGHPAFDLLAGEVRALVAAAAPSADPYPPAALRGLLDRLRGYFFTKGRTPRKVTPPEFKAFHRSKAAARDHWKLVTDAAPVVDDAIRALRRDLNVLLSRAVRQVFAIATAQYRQTLERHGLLDFAELLYRARLLLGNMDEFARSRYLLEARYHHVLVDEFQDTSRAQWELVAQLVRAWGEGFGPAHDAIPPSIFIVGDRKQSIYGFRDADVALLDEAAAMIALLRPDSQPVQTITHSFRSVPQILAFVNDLFEGVAKQPERSDAFRYDGRDRFPLDDSADEVGTDAVLGLAVAPSAEACADAIAVEIERLLRTAVVRDRIAGTRRPAEPGDIAILFRSRESHRAFERALDARGIPTYVYKGLGFFDADEIKDIVALVRFLADPQSDLRAAALLRSRVVRLSDPALQALAPEIARSLVGAWPAAAVALDDEDRAVLAQTRQAVSVWLSLADVVPPAELLDRILEDTAYAFEWKGPRLVQARENVKKIRGLVRRIQNRGYLTLERLADHVDRLSAGDESNAVVDALNAVNLMTVHASKGLEFPVVFVVNLEQGTGGQAAPVRVSAYGDAEDAVAVGDFHTEYDEDATNRDAEETKRLLYVALTRGRDRLYLSAVARDGRMRPARGSLASVCPPGLHALFERAAGPDGGRRLLDWTGPGGHRHVFATCPVGAAAPDGEPVPAPAVSPVQVLPEDYAPVADADVPVRLAVTALREAADHAGFAPRGSGPDRLLAGRLVHRLFQFTGAGTGVAVGAPENPSAGGRGADWRVRAARLLTDDERYAADDAERVIDDAVALFLALRARADVRRVLDGCTCHYEVPFSLRRDRADAGTSFGEGAGSVVVRGVIDCLADCPSGDVVIVDFKTGRPQPGDQSQLTVYEEAARLACPGRAVTGMLVYGQE